MGLPNTRCSVCGDNSDPNWIMVPEGTDMDGDASPMCVGCISDLIASLRARCQPQDGEPSVEEVRATIKYFEGVEGPHIEIMNSAGRALLRRMGAKT